MNIPEINKAVLNISVNYVPQTHAYLDDAFRDQSIVTIGNINYKVTKSEINIPSMEENDITILTKNYVLEAVHAESPDIIINSPIIIDKNASDRDFDRMLKEHNETMAKAVKDAKERIKQ